MHGLKGQKKTEEHKRNLSLAQIGKHVKELRYIVNTETGCWDWQLAKTQSGYARGRMNGEEKRAYRIMYEEVNGPVPANLQLDHLCRNRACVNPDHLEAVTPAENSRRRKNIKLTKDQADLVRIIWRGTKLRHEDIALVFGVSRTSITQIINNVTWK